MNESEAAIPGRASREREARREHIAPSELPDTPMRGYVVLVTAFWSGVAALATARSRRKSPEAGFRWQDLGLLALATHRITTTIARDRVTAPVRAAFVEFERDPESGEIEERPGGGPVRRAVAQLVTCQYCLGPWVAGALLGGLEIAPRPTRFVSAVFALEAASDFLHAAYDRVRG